MKLKDKTTDEKWRARRRWLLLSYFGVAMLVGMLIDNVLIGFGVVLVAVVRLGWLFHRHRAEYGAGAG